MRTPLQEQLLKAGLAKKHKVAEAVRAQKLQREGRLVPCADADRVDAQRLQAERAERDRALAAEQKAQARVRELLAQVRQIVETHKLPRAGEIEYRFTDAGAIKTLLVNAQQRSQLAKGTLVIVAHYPGYALLPRAAAEMVYERQGPIVLDHGRANANANATATVATDTKSDDDAYYQRFVVPDDLIW